MKEEKSLGVLIVIGLLYTIAVIALLPIMAEVFRMIIGTDLFITLPILSQYYHLSTIILFFTGLLIFLIGGKHRFVGSILIIVSVLWFGFIYYQMSTK